MKRKIAEGLIGDVLRKVPISGVSELKIPGDLKRTIVENIENLRESATDVFAQEVSKVLSRVDFQGIIDDVLKNYTLKLEAKIELQPKSSTKPGAGKKKKDDAGSL